MKVVIRIGTKVTASETKYMEESKEQFLTKGTEHEKNQELVNAVHKINEAKKAIKDILN